MKILYTTRGGGRRRASRCGRTSDGRLVVELSIPKEIGGEGGPGTNPEQLSPSGTRLLPLRAAGGGSGSKLNAPTRRSPPMWGSVHRSRRIWLGSLPRPPRADLSRVDAEDLIASARALPLFERQACTSTRPLRVDGHTVGTTAA